MSSFFKERLCSFLMETFSLISNSAQETTQLAKRIAQSLKAKDIVCLSGDLGTGKTTFVKGIAQYLKIKEAEVNSRTFTLLNIYEGKIPLYHFDLYRLDNLNEISRLGYEEFFYGDGICVIEWADKLKQLLPAEYLAVQLKHQGENKRLITLQAHGKRYENISH